MEVKKRLHGVLNFCKGRTAEEEHGVGVEQMAGRGAALTHLSGTEQFGPLTDAGFDVDPLLLSNGGMVSWTCVGQQEPEDVPYHPENTCRQEVKVKVGDSYRMHIQATWSPFEYCFLAIARQLC